VAGCAAAGAAAELGLDVTLFERLEARNPDATAPGITAQWHTPVWGLFDGLTVAASRDDEPVVLVCDAVLIATGSTDQALPFAGCTLPGVMTASGLRRLIEEYRVLPGQRFLIVGDGEDSQAIAAIVASDAGEIVRVVAETQARRMVARGAPALSSVTIEEEELPVDIVVIAVGRQPDVALAAMAGCELVFDAEEAAWEVRVDGQLRASVSGIWAAGDVAGLTDTATAAAEGRFAAAGIALSCGAIDEAAYTRERELFAGAASRQQRHSGEDAVPIRQPWSVYTALRSVEGATRRG
jgi:pyruvate/2-oxoglutarate dehydrogenase complex dihydrolipoamide dehydrogenase (E3) component